MGNALQKWPNEGASSKGCYQKTLTGIKADYNSTDKLFLIIFFKFQEFFQQKIIICFSKIQVW